MENEEENEIKLPEPNDKNRKDDDKKRRRNTENINKKTYFEINEDHTLKVTVEDEGGQKLCISFPNSEDTQTGEGQVEESNDDIPGMNIRIYVKNYDNYRNNSLKKIHCCQSSRSDSDNVEDSIPIIVVDPF